MGNVETAARQETSVMHKASHLCASGAMIGVAIILCAWLISAQCVAAAVAEQKSFELAEEEFDWTKKQDVIDICYRRISDLLSEPTDGGVVNVIGDLCLCRKIAPEDKAVILMKDLLKAEAKEVRLQAAAALARLGDDEAMQTLASEMRSKEKWTLPEKLAALQLLGVSQDDIVTSGLESDDEGIVIETLRLLQRIGDGEETLESVKPFLDSKVERIKLAANCTVYSLAADSVAFDVLAEYAKKGSAEERIEVAEAFILAVERATPHFYRMRQQSVMIRLADDFMKADDAAGWAVASRLYALLGVATRFPAVARKVDESPAKDQARILVSFIQAARLFGTSQAAKKCGHIVDRYGPKAADVMLVASEEAQKEGRGRLEVEHLIVALCKCGGPENVFSLLGKDAEAIEKRARESVAKRPMPEEFPDLEEKDVRNGMFIETPRFKMWRLSVLKDLDKNRAPDLCDLLSHLLDFEMEEGGGIITDAGIVPSDVDIVRELLYSEKEPAVAEASVGKQN